MKGSCGCQLWIAIRSGGMVMVLIIAVCGTSVVDSISDDSISDDTVE
jgi:hypothetical protein